MAARAIWKAELQIGDMKVPVKLYSALQDRDVHFRLLHAADHAPVKQRMVNPETDEPVPTEAIQRGYLAPEGDLVMLEEQELKALEPEPSRDIRVVKFLSERAIDHRWYRRPYYLGPDGADDSYAALAEALAESKREGLAQWVMRNKYYVGALRLHQGYPLLIALRYAEEVVPVKKIEAPAGKTLDKRELSMAEQLIDMLAGDFEPGQYQDEYRQRVMELIQTKASGGKVTRLRPKRKKASGDLAQALEASLKSAGKERKSA